MDEDDDPSLLFKGRTNPCHVVESLPPIYDKRLDMVRHKVKHATMKICELDRVDLVEKLLKGEYVGVNEKVWCGSTLLGVARSIEMADLLIKHGALFKVLDFDCFYYYINYHKLHMIKHFFNHPEFIYTEQYIEIAIANYDNKPIIEILKRKRDRQRAIITMDELGKQYNTNVFTCLKINDYL